MLPCPADCERASICALIRDRSDSRFSSSASVVPAGSAISLTRKSGELGSLVTCSGS